MDKLKRAKNGRFVAGHGFWKGKKRPGFKNNGTFKHGQGKGNTNGFKKGVIPWNKGKKWNLETIQKISLNRSGKGLQNNIVICKYCANSFPCDKSDKRQFCSHDCFSKSLIAFEGMMSSKIRRLGKYLKWQKSVLIRDNFTCQVCGLETDKLHAHHKIPLSELLKKFEIKNSLEARNCLELWDINNGKTLCVTCHRRIHER